MKIVLQYEGVNIADFIRQARERSRKPREPRPAPRFTSRGWTPQEDELLRQWWAQGTRGSLITKRLKTRTLGAVYARASVLGLPRRNRLDSAASQAVTC